MANERILFMKALVISDIHATIKSTMSGKRVLGDTLSCDGLLKL